MEIVNKNIWRPLGHVDLPPQTEEEREKVRQEIIAQAKAEGLI